MDRNREARRNTAIGGSSNGFNRRRHRTNSLRGSPDEEVVGVVELQESVRLRDRAAKKDRDRERDLRERERERDLREQRERDLRERTSRNSSSSKRRRPERFAGDETSDESDNDEEEEDDDENLNGGGGASTSGGGGGVRLLHGGHVSNHHNHHHHQSGMSHQQQHNNNMSTNNNNHSILSGSGNNNHHLQHRKSFPSGGGSSSKVLRAAAPVWKPGDEMIGVSVPRKARSACTKRTHEWISSGSNTNNCAGGIGVPGAEQIFRQESSSPVRQAAAPMSPSSSNASMRKKIKPSGGNNNGPKLKPPKGLSKTSSSNPEELEIEIAEVLYGLRTQPQVPSTKKEDSREIDNRSSGDAKSRVSSPISNSTNHLNLAPNPAPFTATAPKRKRPRQVVDNPMYGGVRSGPVLAKPDPDQTQPKIEISSPCLDKISGSTAENNGYEMGGNPVNSQGPVVPEPELTKVVDSQSKLAAAEESKQTVDLAAAKEEIISSPKVKKSSALRAVDSGGPSESTLTATNSSAATMIKENSVASELENGWGQKFEIDLMAMPPQVRSTPDREIKIDNLVSDQNPILSLADSESAKEKEDEKARRGNHRKEDKKVRTTGEEFESENPIESNKGRNIDLQLDLEKNERDGSASNAAMGNKLQHHQQHQQQMPIKAMRDEVLAGKSGQSSGPLPLPVSMPNWPGAMGYMAPLQGVVSMDGNPVTAPPAPVPPLFSQPRPKKCATHCYIARNISYLQQFMKMNPFLSTAAGPASLFGSKPGPELFINKTNSAPDNKGQSQVNSSNRHTNTAKDKASQTQATASDPNMRKQQQIIVQQALPPVAAPNNLLGPAFIFPINQQQAAVAAAAAASARPAAGKTPSAGGSVASSTTSAGATAASAAVAAAAGGMSFNYPNMPTNETQYLAILQNNGYPFQIPTVGAPQNYRGTPGQAMPLFNGSFYSPQMIHPSQLQQQPPPQPHQNNASASSGSSPSQKQQQRPPPQTSGGGVSGGMNLQNFPTQKSQQLQQQQQTGGEESSPSGTDPRSGPWASVNIYGQNYAMPIHPQNFALMTGPPPGNQTEKKQQQQQQGIKPDSSMPPHSFAMSFGAGGQGIDMASMAQNHAIFQSFPEAARQNMQMMAAAAAAAAAAGQAAVQKKSFRVSEEGKSAGGDNSSAANDEERKMSSGKGQSIAFARSDLAEAHVSSSAQASSNVIESSTRSINAATGPTSRPGTNAQLQAQFQQQQMMHMKQQQHQQQQQQQQLAAAAAAAGNRNKAPVNTTTTTNGNSNIYSDHLNSSSSMSAKFANQLSGFPQSVASSNNTVTPAQSPQWKNSPRTGPTSQAQSTGSMLKSLPQQQQQHARTQSQMHTQISFGGNQKSTGNNNNNNNSQQQLQAPPNSTSNQAPSPPIRVGSPTTSSISKGSSGSPRTNVSAVTNSKMSQGSLSQQQQTKHTQSNIPGQKSPSILGNPQTGVAKPQIQQQQQMMSKNLQQQQQAHLFFSNPYSQAQSPHSTGSATSSPSGYYMQRRRPDQHHQPLTQQQQQQPPLTSSTNDPAKAIAAATSNAKGGGIMHNAQLPAGFSYAHPVQAAVQAKTSEMKQQTATGSDNLHTWQPEKK